MRKDFPVNPQHPERICWGCDQKCKADDLRCGNGSERTPHPIEWWGQGWEKEGSKGIDNEKDLESKESTKIIEKEK